MAVTGKSTIPLGPGPSKTGAKVVRFAEASAQTYPAGALLIKSAGSGQMHTTGLVSTNLWAIALKSGQNATADGAKTGAGVRFEAGAPYKGAVSGSLAASQLGNTAALSQNTAGAVFIITAATASDSSMVRIQEFAEGFAAGDTNPVVLFVPLAAKIQEG